MYVLMAGERVFPGRGEKGAATTANLSLLPCWHIFWGIFKKISYGSPNRRHEPAQPGF